MGFQAPFCKAVPSEGDLEPSQAHFFFFFERQFRSQLSTITRARALPFRGSLGSREIFSHDRVHWSVPRRTPVKQTLRFRRCDDEIGVSPFFFRRFPATADHTISSEEGALSFSLHFLMAKTFREPRRALSASRLQYYGCFHLIYGGVGRFFAGLVIGCLVVFVGNGIWLALV